MRTYKSFIWVFLVMITLDSFGQISLRALFLGNSYTAANNLPQMIADAALSAGDTLLFDSNTPGGYTFQGHSTNSQTLSLISQGSWDFVVLQEQSQFPSFPISQVMSDVYPYSVQLNQAIKQHNPCAETTFFMTWGRKYGDASNCVAWPPVCTYEGMDSLLRLRYLMFADSNNAIVSPVGAVWRHLRIHNPDIDLYEADESHPSTAGSYAAACTFYAILFRKDPTSITWNSSLKASDAAIIRQAAADVAFDSLSYWFVETYNPIANFSYTSSSFDIITFTNLSSNASDFLWDFGDGNSSTLENPVHQYAGNGQYLVQLKAIHCDQSDSTSQTVNIAGIGIDNSTNVDRFLVYPNPSGGYLFVESNCSQPADNLRIEIFSLTGEILHTQSIDQNTVSIIPTEHLNNGIYFFRITGTKNIFKIGRVIISR